MEKVQSSEMATAGVSIEDWVLGLRALPNDDGFIKSVTAYVKTNPVDVASLKPYTFFEEKHYTRNLVFRDELLEVLVLCWEAGHESPAHNHRDQQCWVIMGYGCLENINYAVTERDPARGTCTLEPTSTTRLTRTEPFAVDDGEPVHKVICCPHQNERAMSVHIYSRPFDTCEVYSLEDGTYKDIQLSNWTEYGKRV